MIDKWSYSTVKQTNEGQYAYGYICILVEKHIAQSSGGGGNQTTHGHAWTDYFLMV